MGGLWQDLRYAFRLARRAPKATAAAILTVAVVVGASTGIYSLLSVAILRAVPFPQPHSLVMVYRLFPQGTPGRASYEDLTDWQRRNTSFQALAGVANTPLDLIAGDTPQRVDALSVTGQFFSLLGTPPLLGRWIRDDDALDGANPVAVLSESAWRGMFGADPGVIGRRVRIVTRARDAEYEIIGIASNDTRLHQTARPAVFLPLLANGVGRYGAVLEVVGRLRSGVTLPQASADLTRLIRHGGPYSHVPSGGGRVISMEEADFGASRPRVILLVASVSLVALVGCLNLAALMLALGASRGPEFGVRAACGATRRRVIRQIMTEQGVLASAGGAIGALLAWALVRTASSLAPAELPGIDRMSINGSVFAFTMLVTLVTTLVSGGLPAVLLSRIDVVRVLKGENGFTRSGRAIWRDIVVACQLGLVAATLVGAALCLQSFSRLLTVPLGFDGDNVVAARIALPPRYTQERTRALAFEHQLLGRLRGLPVHMQVALSSEVPPDQTRGGFDLPGTGLVWPIFRRVTADYFELLRIPILRGSVFSDANGDSEVVVNSAFASRYGVTVGSVIPPTFRVVGIVGDTWEGGKRTGPEPACYASFLDVSWFDIWVLGRSALPESALVPMIGDAIKRLDPTLAVTYTTLDAHLGNRRAVLRFYTALLTGFGLFALLLAAMGVYATTHQHVTERTKEIGIRVALGATRPAVARLIAGRFGVLCIAGLAAGCWSGSAMSHALQTVLFDLHAANLTTLALVTFALSVVGAAALVGPLRHATRVDPAITLREG
jgi:predicted permease